MQEWFVAGAVIEAEDGSILLVQNKRRGGALDWTPPGGVVELEAGESVIDGLTREVNEETGLVVTGWEGPLYTVSTSAPELGWLMHVEVHRASVVEGELRVGDDPDGIVVDATYVAAHLCDEHLAGGHPWVREPLLAWLERGRPLEAEVPHHRYEVHGSNLRDARIHRLP